MIRSSMPYDLLRIQTRSDAISTVNMKHMLVVKINESWYPARRGIFKMWASKRPIADS